MTLTISRRLLLTTSTMKRLSSSPPEGAAAGGMGGGARAAICASMRGSWSTGVATRRQATCTSSSRSYSGCTSMAAFSLSHPPGAPAPRPGAKPPPGPSPARPRRGPGGGTGTPWPAQQSGRQSRRAGRSGATVQRPEGGGSLDLEGRRWRLRSGRDERGSDRGRGREGEGRGCRRPGLGERMKDSGGGGRE